jgi:hypothetical protein
MSNTKINGVSLNIEQLNQSLRLKLEKALSALSKPETSMNCSDSNKIDKKYKEEKCYKCKRNCKSRAARCLNGHWIHYICDKLSEEDINNIEHKDAPYKCKACKPCKAIQIKSPTDTFQSDNLSIDQNY